MQFFEMPDGRLVPGFRVTLGEAPEGWDGDLASGIALFQVYTDRGWLLGFLNERLVYKERLSSDQLQALVERWKYESALKTRLELPPPSLRPSPK